jgi:hypothetical protein
VNGTERLYENLYESLNELRVQVNSIAADVAALRGAVKRLERDKQDAAPIGYVMVAVSVAIWLWVLLGSR